jgi:heme/copper-type cytochrome/quinol oxidase subunit 2
MKKRGQVTLFVIIGIVIVVIVALFLVARNTIFMPITSESLESEMDSIRDKMFECGYNENLNSPNELLKTIGKQGGYLETTEGSYRLYADSKVSYLCYNVPGKNGCSNRMLTIKEMEDQLNEAAAYFMNDCLASIKDTGSFKKYDVVTTGTPKYEFVIRPDRVVLNVNWPVTLRGKSKDVSVSEDKFEINFNYPLGQLYDVSQDVINGWDAFAGEAVTGYFDTLTYMLAKKGEYKIYLKKPYPDKVYDIVKEGNEYSFQFAIEGEDRFA